MKYDLIIRDGQVVRDDVARADVAVVDEKIVEIAPQLSGNARQTIDATGLHVFPGLLDPHVHFNEPGRAEWEGIATGSAALSAGGGTLFFDMPLNSSPSVLDGASFDAKLAAMREKSLTDFALWGGLTPTSLDRMEELAARGVIGFKAFMCDSGIDDFPRADDDTLLRGMHIAAKLKLPVAVHAENEEITKARTERAIAEGRTTWRDYLDSRPVIAESEAIRRAMTFAADAGCALHVVHVSDPLCVAQIHAMRQLGTVDVTCETCPHYLALSDRDLVQLGAVAKCAPPLRGEAQRRYLWELLRTGQIDFVASDHSPAPASMKNRDDAFRIWGGIAGIQSTLPILLSHDPPIDPSLIARLTATNAAARFRLPSKGRIDIGYDADVTLIDLNQQRELCRHDLLDRHKLSPYVGRTFRGVVRRTIVRGTTVFLDAKIVSEPQGRLVRPA